MSVEGLFTLTQGNVLDILVGAQGIPRRFIKWRRRRRQFRGDPAVMPLAVAGGGGGAGGTARAIPATPDPRAVRSLMPTFPMDWVGLAVAVVRRRRAVNRVVAVAGCRAMAGPRRMRMVALPSRRRRRRDRADLTGALPVGRRVWRRRRRLFRQWWRGRRLQRWWWRWWLRQPWRRRRGGSYLDLSASGAFDGRHPGWRRFGQHYIRQRQSGAGTGVNRAAWCGDDPAGRPRRSAGGGADRTIARAIAGL